MTDIYIDNIIALCVDLPDSGNAEHMAAGVLLAINAVTRPPLVAEPLPQDPMVMQTKL